MSLVATLDGKYAGDAATVGGWAGFTRWAAGLPAADHAEVRHLANYGWDQELGRLADQLGRALSESPPAEPSVKDTAGGLLEIIEGRGSATVLVVSDGLGGTGEEGSDAAIDGEGEFVAAEGSAD